MQCVLTFYKTYLFAVAECIVSLVLNERFINPKNWTIK